MKGILIVFTTLFMIVTCGGGEDASDPAKIAKKAEETRKGFHCLSAWDGSNSSVVRNVKYKMRDPKSFEHIETRIAPVSNGQHTTVMTYRGRNGFGGMVVQTEYATISNSSCSVI
tara:strand:+ start:274 stop:618 length:345 start_codon:yes stop_codon:yes gene_type:complete